MFYKLKECFVHVMAKKKSAKFENAVYNYEKANPEL